MKMESIKLLINNINTAQYLFPKVNFINVDTINTVDYNCLWCEGMPAIWNEWKHIPEWPIPDIPQVTPLQ